MAKNHRVPPMPANTHSIEEAMRIASIPPNLEWDPNNPMQVNSCSGHSDIHADECDGNCEKNTMDEFDIKIENERREWARAGMDVANYSTNLLRVDVQIQTLIKMVQLKTNTSDEEFNEIFKPIMYEQLHKVRMQFQEAVKQANTRSRIALPGTIVPDTFQ